MKKKIHRKNSAYSLILTICTIIFFGNYIFIKAQTRTEINGPAGSVSFGTQVALLPNGNFVVADPDYNSGSIQNAGAVYLYSAAGTLLNQMTGALVSDRIGAGGITVLTNGDYVVASPLVSKMVGINTVQAIGAVTKCSQTTGCPTQISAANSLFGDKGNDLVGGKGSSSSPGAVIALNNGKYVVRSFYWSLSASVEHAGAVTFCDGATNSCANKIVSAANSLVGSRTDDYVGGNINDSGNNVTILSNGDYVVTSIQWDKSAAAADTGAVTFCSGATGCTGAVSAANSLTGNAGDAIGSSVDESRPSGALALSNNMYVVGSTRWNGVGAVTLCSGTANNCAGQTVTQANSLTGSTFNDNIGANLNVLPGGDYVMTSYDWDKPAPNGLTDAGAVTLCRAASNSCAGQTVSSANSLIGARASDRIGYGRTTVLPNGNYVVSSPFWANSPFPQARYGAATYCNAAANNCAGQTPSAANSLVGGSAMTNDMVSGGLSSANGITVLSNGDYTVSSPLWSAGTNVGQRYLGAVTLCRAATGCAGLVSTANSLTGGDLDYIGYDGVTALTNGNYVVNSSGWSNFLSNTNNGYGAATLCGTNNNCAGQIVSSSNSLTGTKQGDNVGRSRSIALTNGNYVVVSALWDASASVTDVGAVTFCSAANSCANRQVSAANSLVGSTTNDHIGTDRNELENAVTALPNGNYIVKSPLWDNGGLADAGAITSGTGSGGTIGPINSSNSARGAIAGSGVNQGVTLINYAADAMGNKIIIGLPKENKVVLIGAVTPRRAPFDFDGDGKTDIGIFRPSVGEWWYQRSLDGANRAVQFGSSSDKTVPVDYTGDGKTDIAFYRPSDGNWFIIRSEDSTYYASKYGISEDVPAPGDYDGDGKADLAVYRPSSNTWFIQRSSDGGSDIRGFGATGDVPVVADYDGDGKTDIAIFRKSDNSWWHVRSSDGEFRVYQFALGTDKPVIGDWTGDGKADLATYRPTTGEWFIRKSEDLSYYAVPFGAAGDIPAPGDYDGDGKLDTAVYRPSQQVWYINGSTAGVKIITGFGIPEDKPLASSFIP